MRGVLRADPLWVETFTVELQHLSSELPGKRHMLRTRHLTVTRHARPATPRLPAGQGPANQSRRARPARGATVRRTGSARSIVGRGPVPRLSPARRTHEPVYADRRWRRAGLRPGGARREGPIT